LAEGKEANQVSGKMIKENPNSKEIDSISGFPIQTSGNDKIGAVVPPEERIEFLRERQVKIRALALEQMANGNYDGPQTIFEGMNVKQLCDEHAKLITEIARLFQKSNNRKEIEYGNGTGN
jgi:hypothetical protein